MRRAALVLFVVCIAAGPATKPGAKVFDLPGMHGTVDQIREQVHREIDYLNKDIADAQRQVASAQGDWKARGAQVSKDLVKSNAQYAYANSFALELFQQVFGFHAKCGGDAFEGFDGEVGFAAALDMVPTLTT